MQTTFSATKSTDFIEVDETKERLGVLLWSEPAILIAIYALFAR